MLHYLPVPFINIDLININPIYKPPPLSIAIRPQKQVIPRHHPLPHLPVLVKRPILQPVASLPLIFIVVILILVPELHGDAIVRERKELFAETIRLLFLEFRA